MRKPRLTMDGFMEAQDFDRTRGNAIGASDRSMIDAQRDIILGLEARVAELEGAMGNLLLAAEHVSVFVNSRERIQSTSGKTWYEDQLAIARSVLNP